MVALHLVPVPINRSMGKPQRETAVLLSSWNCVPQLRPVLSCSSGVRNCEKSKSSPNCSRAWGLTNSCWWAPILIYHQRRFKSIYIIRLVDTETVAQRRIPNRDRSSAKEPPCGGQNHLIMRVLPCWNATRGAHCPIRALEAPSAPPYAMHHKMPNNSRASPPHFKISAPFQSRSELWTVQKTKDVG